MSTTVNGYPALEPSSPLLHTWIIRGPSGTSRIRMRNGSAGFLLSHLALWFDRHIDKGLVEPLLDDWGYAYRPVRGYVDNISAHAGYAIDLNATDHPLGVPIRTTFTDDEIRAIRRRVAFYDGTITWGGNWSRPDGMHFEITDGTNMPQLERVARRLLDSPRGRRLLEDNPGQRAVILS